MLARALRELTLTEMLGDKIPTVEKYQILIYH